MVTTDRIDGLTAEVAIKAPVRVATTENITLSGTQTIDGVDVVADDRVLVKDQTDGVDNGIYCASTTTWARTKDFNGARDVVQGTKVFVNTGTVSERRNFNLDTADVIVIGTTSLSFSIDTGGVAVSDNLPLVAGTADAGDGLEISRYNHVHPSAKDVAESLANKTLNDDTNFIHANGIHVACRNVSGGDFGVLTPVYDSGWNAGQSTIEILSADANGIGTYPALGLLDAPITNNSNGDVLTDGVILDVDTDGSLFGESWSDGDILYISETAGELTNVRPTAFDAQVQAIARVLRAHGTNGVLFVQGAGRVNAVPNLIDANAQVRWRKGADIASASPLVLGADGNYFNVTGTTGITSVTATAGTMFMLQFDGAVLLTHHATNLNIPGGANVTTSAGDRLICFATGTNTVHVVSYTKADGTALVSGGGGGWEIVDAAVAAASSSVSFTGFDSGYDYLVEADTLLPANDGVQGEFELGVAGPTYRTSNYVTAAGDVRADGVSLGVAATTHIPTGSSAHANVDGEQGILRLLIYNPEAAVDTYVKGSAYFTNNGSIRLNTSFGGFHNVAEAIDAVKFAFSAGNIATGNFKLYRRPNA